MVNTINHITFRNKLHEISISTTLEFQVQCIDIFLRIGGDESSILLYLERIWIFLGNLFAVVVSPCDKVIAKVLSGFNCE